MKSLENSLSAAKNYADNFLRYDMLSELGHGSFTRVVKANDIKQEMHVALKLFSLTTQNHGIVKHCARELQALLNIQHPNIVKINNVYKLQTNHEFLIIVDQEYVNQDLRHLLKMPNKLNPAQVKKMIYEILKGLLYIHSMNLIHRDLKPSNILAGLDYTIKLCDFGLSRFISSKLKEDLVDDNIPDEKSEIIIAKTLYFPGSFTVGIHNHKIRKSGLAVKAAISHSKLTEIGMCISKPKLRQKSLFCKPTAFQICNAYYFI